jgi:hypothetical protein
MKLLVKNHQKENEPKEPIIPGKEEAKPPSVMKKCKKIWWAQRKDICDCEGTMQQYILDMKNNKVESLKGNNLIEANDDVISKTAGQPAISWIPQKIYIMCWCGRIPIGDPSADGGSNKWNKWENIKRQVYNLHFFAGVDTKRYGKLKITQRQ